MRKLLFILVILILGNSPIWSSEKNTDPIKDYWKILKTIKIKYEFDDTLGRMVGYPKFNKRIHSIEGKTIYLNGYLFPGTMDDGTMILSMFSINTNPNSCFGLSVYPETSIKLNSKRIIKNTDSLLTIKGILRINNNDLDFFYYELDDVEIIQETLKK